MKAAGRPAQAVALNAGVGAGGAFATDTALEDELRIIDLNVRSTVRLAKHVVRDMVERDEGRILFTSSIAATMPGAFQAVYSGPSGCAVAGLRLPRPSLAVLGASQPTPETGRFRESAARCMP